MHRSGRESYRVVCAACGANFFIVMQLVAVEPSGDEQISSLEADCAGGDTRTT